MKLKFCEGSIDDWFTIEKAEHDNVKDIRQMPYGGLGLYYSGRISDACVEGTLEEMRAIAQAIINKKYNDDARRCAVDATGEVVTFWSPRNSTVDGEATYEEALDLAKQIMDYKP